MTTASPSLPTRLLAETLGTALLVTFGCAAVMVDGLRDGALGLVGIAITWASLVAILVYAFGHSSGTQINPAVTLALWSTGRLPSREVAPHLIAQLVGATVGSALTVWLLGRGAGVAMTTLSVDPVRGFVVEFLASFLLMATVLGAGVDERTPRGFAALAVGLTVGLCVLVAGPLTGASMNPARSFGPALMAGDWTHHWVYWVAPIVGMRAAAFVLPRLGVGGHTA
jgi:MIP family channel proteins